MIAVGFCVSRSLHSPGVVDRPDRWIQSWLHNGFGLFDHAEDAMRVIPEGEEASYRLFALRLHPTFYRRGQPLPVAVASSPAPDPMPASFSVVGFGVMGRSLPTLQEFDGAPVDAGLLPSLDAAIEAARRVSADQPEWGDCYVAEVSSGELEYSEPDVSEFPSDPPAPGEPDLIAEYKEWAAHRYDPGHYLGGTLHPHLRKYALGPRGRRIAAALLALMALSTVVSLPLADPGTGERIMVIVWGLVLAAAAWRMSRS